MTMDRGIWMTWYNLPEQGRNEYLSWLHSHYIPNLLKLPGYLWAAHYASEDNVKMTGAPNRLGHTVDAKVPTGDRYILLFGAADAHVFVNPTPAQLRERLSDSDKKMLATRIGERHNIATEENASTARSSMPRNTRQRAAPRRAYSWAASTPAQRRMKTKSPHGMRSGVCPAWKNCPAACACASTRPSPAGPST